MKIPKEVTIKKIGDEIYVEGKHGSQKARIEGVEIKENTVEVKEKVGQGVLKKMIEGVSKGNKAKLKINGVGFKARVEGGKIVFNIGYKDEKIVKIPGKVGVKVEGNTIIGHGDMKSELKQVMSNMTKVRPAKKDKYKGKGIREE